MTQNFEIWPELPSLLRPTCKNQQDIVLKDVQKHLKSVFEHPHKISIKDYLIPHVSSSKTPKKMFDALTKLYKGKSINWNMTLRT